MPFFNPSLDDVNKEVLGWDLYQILAGKPMYSLRDVPINFSSVDQYLDIFEPLLLEECRAQTLRSLKESEHIEHHLKLQAVEDSIDEFCGKQTGIQAVALIPGHGEVKSKESFRECDDFKAAMAEIHAAKQ